MGRISRRTFGKSVLSGMAAARALGKSGPSRVLPLQRPNIVFICSDQHSGLHLLGHQGREVEVRTPNLRRLASSGVLFPNAYCVSPVCAPARASLLTGQFASDLGSYGNATPFDGQARTWGNYLSRAGYLCWATGKMDLTPEVDLGFQQAKTSHEHHERPDITELFRRPMCYRVDERPNVNGEVGESGGHDPAVLQAGLEFLRQHAPVYATPWAAYLGFLMPHPPFRAPQEYWALYPPDQVRLPNIPPGYLDRLHLDFQILRQFKMLATPPPEEQVRRARSAYFGMISELDGRLGKILDELEKADALENTLIVYTSDHGEMLGEHGLWFKNVLLEGAARVPLILAGAGLPQGQTVETPVSHVDLVATLLDVAGVARPETLRGFSLLPLITGDSTKHPGHVYAESHSEGNCTGSFMIRQGDWKYIYFSWYGDNLLFNLREDPGELSNLAKDPKYAPTARALHSLLTSLVDPDTVTERAFEKQQQALRAMVQKKTAEEFYGALEARLGRGQAAALTYKYYPGGRLDLEHFR